MDGHQYVVVEAFITSDVSQIINNGIVDFPCELTGAPGSTGTISAVSISSTACTGAAECPAGTGCGSNLGAFCAAVGPGTNANCGPSSEGVSYLFGSSPICPAFQSDCRMGFAPCLGCPPTITLSAGETRFLGKIVYLVSDCAAGDFNVVFENWNSPPQSADKTRFQQSSTVSIPLNPVGITLTVPSGPCCVGTVFGTPSNDYCCDTMQGGCSSFRLVGDSCASAIFGDAYPAETFGDGVIDVDDILCVRDNFVYGSGACPSGDIWPCDGPDGIVDVDDFIGVLGAFVGEPPCPNPCE